MKTRNSARGRWGSILPVLGVASEFLDGRNRPCPMCGGRDRFRYSDKDGNGEWICSHCTEGKYEDGFTLLEKLNGWSFAETAKQVDATLPNTKPAKVTEKPDPRKRLNSVRSALKPADAEVSAYLASRGLEVAPGLKQGRLRYWHGKQDMGMFDCMVGLVMIGNKACTYHITYLKDGAKADVPTPRKVLPPAIPFNGGAVRLYPPAEVMGIAEGIETAIAASMIHGVPVWSALNANNLEKFNPPDVCRKLIVFGDTDASFAGQKSAYVLAERIARKGIETEVRLPKSGDWNDHIKGAK